MKRCFSLITAALLVIALAGCGKSSTDNSKEEEIAVLSENTQAETSEIAQVETSESTQTENSGSDILVVYFSRTGEQYGVGVIDEGNTAIVARMIAEQTDADTFEILPADDYYGLHFGGYRQCVC